MIIQKVLQTDLVEILALQKDCYLQEAAIYDDYTRPPLLQTISSIAKDFRQQVFLKMVANEQIISSIRAYMEDGICKIGRLIVHPNFQNKGEWQQDELWRGKEYPIWQPYQNGYPIKTTDPN